jgi:hypothetical protein
MERCTDQYPASQQQQEMIAQQYQSDRQADPNELQAETRHPGLASEIPAGVAQQHRAKPHHQKKNQCAG